MNLFKFFKKKQKLSYNPTDMSVLDLKKGFIFEYDGKSWEIKEEFEYDWGEENFTYEFKIYSGEEVKFLHIQNEDRGVLCSITERFPIYQIGDSEYKKLLKKQKPPKNILFQNIEFIRVATHYGYFRNISVESFQEFINWEYEEKKGNTILEIEQWDKENFELSFGVQIDESRITNILPRFV